MSIAEKLRKLLDIKVAIKEALFFVGQEVADKMEDWAVAIRNICNVPLENLGYTSEESKQYNDFLRTCYENGKFALKYMQDNPESPNLSNARMQIHNIFLPKIINDTWGNYCIARMPFESKVTLPKVIIKTNPYKDYSPNSFFVNIELVEVEYLPERYFGNSPQMRVLSFNANTLKDMSKLFSYTSKNRVLRELNITGLGTQPECTYTSFMCFETLGINISDFPNSKQSLVDTLLTNSFNRASVNYEPMIIELRNTQYNALTEEEITAITNKGYTITVG
jgi:hypothetical protein